MQYPLVHCVCHKSGKHEVNDGERFAASNVFLNTLVNMGACYPIQD